MKKKILIITSSIVCGCILAGALITGLCISSAKKTTVVGFYNLPEEYVSAIENQISKMEIKKLKFKNLTEDEFLSSKSTKNNSIIFAYNDLNTKTMADDAVPLNKDILTRMPSTIKNSAYFQNSKKQVTTMPVLMDNFETSVLRTTRTKYGIQWPETFNELQTFGKKAKQYYPAPLIISGELDINILSLFTEMVIAFGGQTGYEAVKNQLQKSESFEELLNTQVTDQLTVKAMLNELKELQKNGYIIPSWTTLKERDTYVLIDDNRTGAIFMNLSENRRKTMPNIHYYEILTFPVETEYKELSVQPVVVGLSFKNTQNCQKILTVLSTEEVQTDLSMETQLGPAMLRGGSFDIQADEARYLAASTRGGPVPDLGTAAYRKVEQRHALAENIRKWFE